MIEILFNGEMREVAAGTSVAVLLDQLGLAGKPLAVEVNLRLVPRGNHGEHFLAAGDQIEVVTLVGGG